MRFIHTGVDPIPDITSKDTSKGRFYTTPEGNVYPSITTILGSVVKPAVAAWRESLGVNKANAETKRATERGSAVHQMIENYLNNDVDPTNGFISEHIREFKSVKPMLNQINNIRCQEIPLYSDTLRVAGRVDCIGEYKGKLSIIDFKTSTNDKSSSIIQDYYMQTAAYAIMFQELYDIQVNEIVIIMSVERGIVPLVFKQQVDGWIAPLCKRINTYQHNNGRKV